MNKKRNYIIFLVVLIGLIYMMKDALLQPGPQDLKGNFEELAFIRNENNTGPVLRLYAVSLQDTLWKEMETYGNYMPHTKYGQTKVYYFLKGTDAPSELSLITQLPASQYLKNCVGMYVKDPNGQVYVTRYPFR